MLGAASLYLRAEKNGTLPEFTGRVMHGVFFKTLGNISPELAEFVHDELSMKPFSASELIKIKKYKCYMGKFQVQCGDLFKWRIATVNEDIFEVIAHIPLEYKFQVNKIPMVLEKTVIDGTREPGTGVMSDDELLGACLSIEKLTSIKVKYVSPTTFRVNQNDYPLPIPKLFFASLADKWEKAGMPVNIDREYIRELSEKVYLSEWQGKTFKTYLAGDRGVRAFKGEFLYELSELSMEERQIMLLLAQFGCFVGCGRMTGQGLGQMEVKVR